METQKITNEQKFKTAEERVKAFAEFCKKQGENCERCPFEETDERFANCVIGFANWLALEAEEERTEPCPFCGVETHSNLGHLKAGVVLYWVDCLSPDCMYRSAHYADKDEAIAAHNRMARAVRAANEGEVK